MRNIVGSLATKRQFVPRELSPTNQYMWMSEQKQQQRKTYQTNKYSAAFEA